MNFRASSTFTGLNQSVALAIFSQAALLSVEQGAEAVLETAESIVPVDTGELHGTGHVEVLQASGPQPSAAVIFDAPYAAYVEYGTGERGAASPGHGDGPYDPNWPGMVAQPYVRPALDIERPHIVEIFRDNVAAATKLLGG